RVSNGRGGSIDNIHYLIARGMTSESIHQAVATIKFAAPLQCSDIAHFVVGHLFGEAVVVGCDSCSFAVHGWGQPVYSIVCELITTFRSFPTGLPFHCTDVAIVKLLGWCYAIYRCVIR